MSNIKISALTPETGTIPPSAVIPIAYNGNNYSITYSQLPSASPLTLSGQPVSSFNPSNFTLSNGVLGPVAGSSGTTLTFGGSTLTTAALDSSFTVSSGTISVNQTAFSSLATGTLTGTSQILIVNGSTAYSATLAQLAAEIATLNLPTITISTIASQTTGSGFTVSGMLSGYQNPPTLTFEDNAGSFAALPSATISTTAFSFTHPSLSTAGAYTVTIHDENNVSATSNTFTVAAPSVSAASFTSQPPSSGGTGVAITSAAIALTPSGGTAWAALYKAGTQEGSRVSFTGSGAVPSLTPASTGSYTLQIFASNSSTTALATSNAITVSLVTPNLANGTAPSMHLDASAPNSVTSDAALTTPQTTNGGLVRGWIDQTANHYNFAMSGNNGTSLVTNAKNGLNGILLNRLDGLTGPQALANAIQAIVKGNTGGVTFAFVGLMSDVTRLTTAFGMISTQQVIALTCGGNPGMIAETTSVFGGSSATYQRIIGTINAATKTVSVAYNNGTLISGTYSISGDTATSAPPYIGATYSGADNVTFLEQIVWNGVATQADVSTIDTYFLNKWGT